MVLSELKQQVGRIVHILPITDSELVNRYIDGKREEFKDLNLPLWVVYLEYLYRGCGWERVREVFGLSGLQTKALEVWVRRHPDIRRYYHACLERRRALKEAEASRAIISRSTLPAP